SRTEHFALDVKGIDVKAELDQPCDVLVIMLGMNDVLAPYVMDDPASLEKWETQYRELVTALQSRLKPKVTAVATITLCTEDTRFSSPKNGMIRVLNQHIWALANEMELIVVSTNTQMQIVLSTGRCLK